MNINTHTNTHTHIHIYIYILRNQPEIVEQTHQNEVTIALWPTRTTKTTAFLNLTGE